VRIFHGAGLAAVLALCLAGGARGEDGLPVLAGVEASGWAVAYADGRRVVADAQGGAALTGDGRVVRPMTAQTPVRIASVSKLALALALNRLADAGKLSLDDDASMHLGWPLRHPDFPDAIISIRMLLRHEGSVSDAGGYGGKLGERLRDRIGAQSWSAARPGTQFDYSNLNSALLAEIVEAVTGARFDRAMATLVFQPLGVAACFNWSGCAPGFADGGAVLYRKSADFGEHWDRHGPWVAQVDAERPAEGCPVQRPDGLPCDLTRYVPGDNGGLFSPQGGLRISVQALAQLGAAVAANRGGFLKPETHKALFRAMPVQPHGDGAESDARLTRYWSAGGLHCFSGDGAVGGDQPLAPRPTAGCGHLGEAYGLYSALVMNAVTGDARAWAMTGSADDPPAGRRSRFNAMAEELAARAYGLQ